MRSRLLAAVAVAALASAAIVAPAAAQSGEPREPRNLPPVLIVPLLLSKLSCVADPTVPGAVNCGFDNAVWALEVAQGVARYGQDTFNREFETVSELAQEGFVVIDDAQKLVVGELCHRLGIPPDECPDI